MLYITANLADKLLPIASRGDIEGALLAICLNSICLLIIGFGIFKTGKILRKVLGSFYKERAL